MEHEQDLVTLDEALAFIDSLDSTELSDSSSGSFDNDNDNDNDSNSKSSPVPTAQTSNPPKRRATKRKRKRCNLSSSTRLQQRKKAELLYLRKYVQELEEKRIKLETWDKGFSQVEVDDAEGSVWMNLAKTHFQARLRSETANRTLKTMLTSQTQVIDLLQNIVHKQTFTQEMDLASLGETWANVEFSTEIDNINASLKGVNVACSQYFDTGALLEQ